MRDTIYRQEAIDALGTPHGILYPIRTIEELPSAQPQTKLIAKITLNKEQVQDAVEKAKREILDAQPQ